MDPPTLERTDMTEDHDVAAAWAAWAKAHYEIVKAKRHADALYADYLDVLHDYEAKGTM